MALLTQFLMPDLIFQTVILILAGAAAGGVVYYFGWLSLQAQYVILADGRRQERSLPLLIRAVLPLAARFAHLLQGTIARRHLEELDRRILSAGFDGLITSRELVMTQVWLGLLSCVFGMLLAREINVLLVVFSICAFLYPGIWLRGVVAERHRVIQRGLPFMLDLLTLCVEAGLDFMSAMSRIIDRRKMDALSEEMMRVFQGIKLGRTRRQALKEMRDRVNLPDLSVVVNALIQADELGVSLGAILRIQSEQLRTKRFQRAETLANQAPTKMLFPLVFIFLAAFIILVGPVLVQIFQRLM
ncbi:MAG: type II secretion system F family protein [Verrucomicrobia bacterium]|nr:type II secretion system F family protein [Verrucomicrobiota bacterium]